MNQLTQRIHTFLSKPFFSDPRTLLGLWLLLPVVSALMKINKCNNFLIFKYVFWHTWNGEAYPEEYFDVNHYGPLFSMVIAPFAVLPHPLGLLFWHVAMALVLFVSIRKLPVRQGQQIMILWYCAHELLTALFMSQFNIAVAAIVIGTFVCIEKEREGTAALLIVLGTLVKLYGIVGLAFFFFSRHKVRFVLWMLAWGVVLFALPMLISSGEYVMEQYREWYICLTEKNTENLMAGGQNISLLGMVRKISGCMNYSDLWLIVPGVVLFAGPYLRLRQYRHLAFRLMWVASVLMFTVLFSTGSESSGYIIALAGVGIWYVAVPWKRSKWDVALMVFAFILTSMSPSDLFPAFLRKQYVQPYALKALPCILIWGKLMWEMYTKDYAALPQNDHHNTKEEQ